MDETSILRPEAAVSALRARSSRRLAEAVAGPLRRLRALSAGAMGSRGVFEEFAARLARASTSAEVRDALALAAARLSGGARARYDREAVGADGVLVVPLRFAGRLVGTLRLVPDRPRTWPERLTRRLGALAALAAAAEQALGRPGRPMAGSVAAEPSRDPVTGLHRAGFLDAYLVQAVALAGRRCEPLSLLAIAPDGLAELRRRDGPEFADAALGLVARAVVATLRASDLVARLDPDRLAAVLPGAARADALRVAEVLRRAIAEAGIASAAPTALTASLGLAALPDDAGDASSLRAAAESALESARREGGDRVAAPEDRAAGTDLRRAANDG